MEATCREDKCSYWVDGKCPFSLETWWKPMEGQPKLIRDCAPIRTLVMVQELYNQIVGLHKAQDEQREQSLKVNLAFLKLLNVAIENKMQGEVLGIDTKKGD